MELESIAETKKRQTGRNFQKNSFHGKIVWLRNSKGSSFSLHIHRLNRFSNFRTIDALTTISSFNGENRQRTSNTWRPEQWWLSRKGSFSFQDLLTDLFQQKLHYLITGQRIVSSKWTLCGNTYCRHNLRMHHRR